MNTETPPFSTGVEAYFERRGTVSFWCATLDDRQDTYTHSFSIRREDAETLRHRITDHAHILS
jgi:hypothetical protein